MIGGPISRWADIAPIADDRGRVVLPEREPFSCEERADTRRHTVLPGDTLAVLAGRYFAPLPRACGYWWALCEFQPEPIVDPTLSLATGRVLHVPSVAALEEYLGGGV